MYNELNKIEFLVSLVNFYFFHVANRTFKVACVARVLFGEEAG